MRLAPKGYINPHSDSSDMGLRAVNISLNNPGGCKFNFEKMKKYIDEHSCKPHLPSKNEEIKIIQIIKLRRFDCC